MKQSEYGDLSDAIEYALGPMIPTEGYSGPAGMLSMDIIEKIVFEDRGEKDERNWLWVLLLKDGRWVFVNAGCDYTGWD